MIYVGAFDCALIATAIKWKDKVNKGTKPYHLDNKSPHVSRIFSAHSLETSPDPLSNGSSLSRHREKRTQMFQMYQDVAYFTRGHFVLRCLMECLLKVALFICLFWASFGNLNYSSLSKWFKRYVQSIWTYQKSNSYSKQSGAFSVSNHG